MTFINLFTNRIVDVWNNLSCDISAEILFAFKRKLYRFIIADFVPSPPDTVDEGILLSGFPSAEFVRPSVLPFVRTDLVTTISHERLEQSQ